MLPFKVEYEMIIFLSFGKVGGKRYRRHETSSSEARHKKLETGNEIYLAFLYFHKWHMEEEERVPFINQQRGEGRQQIKTEENVLVIVMAARR